MTHSTNHMKLKIYQLKKYPWRRNRVITNPNRGWIVGGKWKKYKIRTQNSNYQNGNKNWK